MVKGFRFNKNARGYSDKTFSFMRKTIIPTTKYLFNPRIVNPEYMPQTGPCFIYGNHSNYFDPFLINVGMLKEPTAGVMTRDQFHKPIPRIFMDSIGIVPTSKYVPEPGIVRSVIKMIDQKRMIVIFPEGGRRWDGKPKPLIETTLKLFWKMKIPIHPVQLHGSYLAWPRWADNYRKNSMEVRFLKPLHASDFDDYETFADHCRNLIAFDEYEPPESVLPYSCSKPAKGIERFLYRCPDTGRSGGIFTPDGENVYSRYSDLHYKMNLASRLIDRDGKEHSIIGMFDRINQMPIEYLKEGVVLEKTGCKLSRVNKEHQLVRLGRSIAELNETHVKISLGSDRYLLPLEEIRYTSIEQNHKLTLTTTDLTLQLNLAGQSALQWQTYINRMRDGDQPVKSA
jgi:1-acyl-sn-glycerol-3-phosphate acyltransferase